MWLASCVDSAASVIDSHETRLTLLHSPRAAVYLNDGDGSLCGSRALSAGGPIRVNHDTFDPETLAAFLDGKSEGDERERVLQLLAESDEWYEVMVDAIAVSAALAQSGEAASGLSSVVASPSLETLVAAQPAGASPESNATRGRLVTQKVWGRQAMIGGGLIAAGLTAVLVFSDRPAALDAVDGPSQLVVDDRLRAGSAADWGAARGNTESLSARARAFRIGAQFADLELAFRTRDSSRVRSLSSSIANLTVDLAAGRSAASRVLYLARDGSLRASTKERREVASEVRSFAAEPWFDLGAWSETARRAALAGQYQFFNPGRPGVQRLDSLLAALDRLPAVERSGADAAIARLRALRSRGEPRSGTPEGVAAVLDSTIAELGR